MTSHPPTWWFRLLNRFWPSRCREIPEATNPDVILLRQFAIWKKHIYLQQFACSENAEWMHSHPWPVCVAIGLYGGYTERRHAVASRIRRAPYFYAMGSSVIHSSVDPTPGHTSVFIGLGTKHDDRKAYYPATIDCVGWRDHVKRMVKRL